nr:hypothetical protein [Rhodococcus sp. 15-1154-1]
MNMLTSANRLEDLAQLAEACRETFLAVAADSHWAPAPRSAASQAKRLASSQDPASTSVGHMAGFDLVSEVLVTYLEVAAGHLAGLAALYRGGEVMFPPLPLARSIIENCAAVMWVIGTTSPSEKILARAYLVEFASCEFAKIAAGRMGSEDDDAYKDTKQRWTLTRARAIAAFPGTSKQDLSDEKPGRTLAGEVLPGLEASVAQMFKLVHEQAQGSVSKRQALGIYSFLCAGTHPSLYQARQMRIAVDHGDHHGTDLKIEISHVENIARTAILAFYNALSYTISFYGFSREPHDKLTDGIELVFPGSLT